MAYNGIIITAIDEKKSVGGVCVCDVCVCMFMYVGMSVCVCVCVSSDTQLEIISSCTVPEPLLTWRHTLFRFCSLCTYITLDKASRVPP